MHLEMEAATPRFLLKERANRVSHPNPGHVLSHFPARTEERTHHKSLMFPVDTGVYPWSGCAGLSGIHEQQKLFQEGQVGPASHQDQEGLVLLVSLFTGDKHNTQY